jgi:tRNA(His) guanylyltransferase
MNFTAMEVQFKMYISFSFLFRKSTSIYGRRSSKILSTVVSLFTSAYIMNWHRYFDTSLPNMDHPPSFDGRIVLYPSEKEVRDYFAWRQVDSK